MICLALIYTSKMTSDIHIAACPPVCVGYAGQELKLSMPLYSPLIDLTLSGGLCLLRLGIQIDIS